MSGIIGIQENVKSNIAEEMLSKIKHRGNFSKIASNNNGFTIGIVANSEININHLQLNNYFCLSDRDDSTSVAFNNTGYSLKRDKFGVEPLYYTFWDDNRIAFASEVKALLQFNSEIYELLPGNILENSVLQTYYVLEKMNPIHFDTEDLSKILKKSLSDTIKKRIHNNCIGAWLSGGLDSSAICAIARHHVDILHTFSVGFKDAPDLYYAKKVADHISSIHHERIISFDEVLNVLPNVIYHLESFDNLLVRSSIMNYLVSNLAHEYTNEVFSGEGGDELFAGYHYIKELDTSLIADELIDITSRLHNTALQRVDRSSNAFGTTAHVPFLDENIVDLAIRIPVKYKLHNGIEKWILRLALSDELPNDVLIRDKSKFWEGSGIGELLYMYAEDNITDNEFNTEKKLKCGWVLNSKEELMYFRIFKEFFGDLNTMGWMGRTKNVKSDLINT